MIIASGHYGELIGVLGLGRTGLSAVHSLLAGGASVAVWDDRMEMVESLRLLPYRAQSVNELILGKAILEGRLIIAPIPEEYMTKLAAFLPSPGVPISYPKPHHLVQLANEYNIPICSDSTILQSVCPQAKYVGITGTNGKSTTTSLLGHIYRSCSQRHQVGGNIGIPMLELEPLEESGTYILELSSFQLELVLNFRLDTAVLLNITPDHLDRYKSMDDYIKAKYGIFANQPKNGFAIVSADYDNTRQIIEQLIQKKWQRVIPISTHRPIEGGIAIVDGILYDYVDGKASYELGKIPNLLGQHNAENMVAAYAVCRMNGMESEQIIQALRTFVGLPHRMQKVLESGGLVFINDSKATNADSARKALETFENIIWIAGGICKDDGIEALADLFNKIKHAYLVGQAANQFAEVLSRHNVPHTIAGTLEKAMGLISAAQYTNGTVLLAPSCASFDQWKNFEERGTAFGFMAREKFAKPKA